MVKALPKERIPKHIGVMLDGNRRWAKGVGGDTAHGLPRRCRQHRAAARLVRGGRRRGRHPVAALHRQPEPPARAARAGCSTDHRRRRRRARRAAPLADPSRSAPSTCCPRRSPTRLKEAEEATRDVDGLLVNVAVRLRRPPRDRRRRPLAAPGARRARHHARGAGRGHRRRPHRRAPLHQGPARSRPGDPDLGGAAARRLPAVAERPERVLLLRGLLARLPPGRLPAGDPRLRRSASAASAPEPQHVRLSHPGVHSAFVACRLIRHAGAAYVRDIGRAGKPGRIGRPVRECSRPVSAADSVARRGPALRPSDTFPVHLLARQDRAKGARAVW